MTKTRGKAVLAWRIGSLRFRMLWKGYYEKKNMSTTCPFPLCGSDDTYDHSTRCLFMNTKINNGIIEEDFRIADYLIRLNNERNYYKKPIL